MADIWSQWREGVDKNYGGKFVFRKWHTVMVLKMIVE